MDYLLSEELQSKHKKFYRLSKADLRVIPGGKLVREKKQKKILRWLFYVFIYYLFVSALFLIFGLYIKLLR